jgi:hypothetical protein
MYPAVEDLSKYRQRIIDDAMSTFKGMDFFRGLGRPTEDVAMAVCEGLLDLLMEPDKSRDPKVVRMFMEWLYNLLRKDGTKIDTTINFLDTYEGIVARYLTNKEDSSVDVFFELCKDIVQKKHKEMIR